MSMGAYSLALGVDARSTANSKSTRITPGQAPLNDDEDIFAAPNDVEFFQSQPPVADAFAGLQLVFITVPRADEMNLVGERLPLIGAVHRDHVDHAVDHEPLAGRSAGMDTSVAVGEVGAVLVEHADFRVSSNDNAPIAVLHLGRLGNEAFRHGALLALTLAWRRREGWCKKCAAASGGAPSPNASCRPRNKTPLIPAKAGLLGRGLGPRFRGDKRTRLWPQRCAQRWEFLDPSRVARIALQTRCGVAGMSMCSMPIPESASSTAFMSTAELGVMPASPPPLTRSALPLVGSSVSSTSRCGKSSARGMP